MSMASDSTIPPLAPDNPDELHRRGIAAYRSGNLALAHHFFSAVLSIQPDNPVALSHFGVVCRSMGDLVVAETSLQRALMHCPLYADAWNNLGAVYEKSNQELAKYCFKRALQLQPDLVSACNNLGLWYKRQQQFAAAAAWYRKSLVFNRAQPKIWCRLAEMLEQNSDVEGAHEAYSRSWDLVRDDAVLLKIATLLPVIIPSVDGLIMLREALLNNLSDLQSRIMHIERPWENGRVFFYLAYHGKNDLLLHQQLAALYRRACPELTWQASHVGKIRLDEKRIRIGFISRFFSTHTIAKLNIGLIEQLDRSRFHVSVLLIDAGIRDEMVSRFAAAADMFVALTGDFFAMREQIAMQKLDVLYYTDIGMEPYSYFFAFSRLASIQCVTWGHPATTGIDTVDWFISHAAAETETSRFSYSERLFCLSNAAAPACYARLNLPPSDKTRQYFGLGEQKTIYYCPQPPFKLHPDFDLLLRRILTRDPEGVVVLLRGAADRAEAALRERFGRVMPELLDRILFMNPLPYADYIQMLQLADVVLDTPHFSGGSSSVEALAVGVPVVTMPSVYLKGRLTAAWYQRIGVTDCIAAGPEEYVALAVRLAHDSVFRETISRRIRATNHRLFDDHQTVSELETFFETVLYERKALRHTLP